MTMNPLPPQAYTKDTLVKAFQWIQMQPADIKQLASTPDVLVSLYLKAKLQGEAVLERPSIQNFKNELKNLAGQLGEFAPAQEILNERAFEMPFERPAHAFATPPAPQTASHAAPQMPSAFQQSLFQAPPAPAATQTQPQFQFQTPPQSPPVTPAPQSMAATASMASAIKPPAPAPAPIAPIAKAGSGMADLDEKSLALVREIRELGNLQSDAEAMRLLIAAGFKQLKNVLR